MAFFPLKQITTNECPIGHYEFYDINGANISQFIYLSKEGDKYLNVQLCHLCGEKISDFILKLNPDIKPDTNN